LTVLLERYSDKGRIYLTYPRKAIKDHSIHEGSEESVCTVTLKKNKIQVSALEYFDLYRKSSTARGMHWSILIQSPQNDKYNVLSYSSSNPTDDLKYI
jgi:hypothetical protein